MKRGEYAATSIGGGAVRIDTRPLMVLGPVRMVGFHLTLFIALFGLIGGTGHGWPGLLVVAFWVYAFYLGDRNKGRKVSSFEVQPNALVLPNGEGIARADVAKLYTIAPKQSETVYHSGFVAGGGIYSGRSKTAGWAADIVARSYRVVIEAKGKEYTLAGGLSPVTANALLHEIGRVWR